VRDPELKSAGQTLVCYFAIAVNDGTKDREHVSYFDCKAWGKRAEAINKYFQKGSPILLECRAYQERWNDQAGKVHTKIVFNVESFEFVGGKKTTETDVASTLESEMGATAVDENNKDIPF